MAVDIVYVNVAPVIWPPPLFYSIFLMIYNKFSIWREMNFVWLDRCPAELVWLIQIPIYNWAESGRFIHRSRNRIDNWATLNWLGLRCSPTNAVSSLHSRKNHEICTSERISGNKLAGWSTSRLSTVAAPDITIHANRFTRNGYFRPCNLGKKYKKKKKIN